MKSKQSTKKQTSKCNPKYFNHPDNANKLAFIRVSICGNTLVVTTAVPPIPPNASSSVKAKRAKVLAESEEMAMSYIKSIE